MILYFKVSLVTYLWSTIYSAARRLSTSFYSFCSFPIPYCLLPIASLSQNAAPDEPIDELRQGGNRSRCRGSQGNSSCGTTPGSSWLGHSNSRREAHGSNPWRGLWGLFATNCHNFLSSPSTIHISCRSCHTNLVRSPTCPLPGAQPDRCCYHTTPHRLYCCFPHICCAGSCSRLRILGLPHL